MKIDVDLTNIRQYFFNINKNVNFEMDIITNYSYYVTEDMNTYERFIKNILNVSYKKEDTYPYYDINTFYKEAKVLDHYERFITMLQYYITKNISPYFENITYDSTVEDGDKLIVKFDICLG